MATIKKKKKKPITMSSHPIPTKKIIKSKKDKEKSRRKQKSKLRKLINKLWSEK